MAAHHWKVQESSSCSLYKAGCLRWPPVHRNSEEAGSNANEGMDCLAGRAQAGRERLPSPMSFDWMPAGGVVRIKGGSPTPKYLN